MFVVCSELGSNQLENLYVSESCSCETRSFCHKQLYNMKISHSARNIQFSSFRSSINALPLPEAGWKFHLEIDMIRRIERNIGKYIKCSLRCRWMAQLAQNDQDRWFPRLNTFFRLFLLLVKEISCYLYRIGYAGSSLFFGIKNMKMKFFRNFLCCSICFFLLNCIYQRMWSEMPSLYSSSHWIFKRRKKISIASISKNLCVAAVEDQKCNKMKTLESTWDFVKRKSSSFLFQLLYTPIPSGEFTPIQPSSSWSRRKLCGKRRLE